MENEPMITMSPTPSGQYFLLVRPLDSPTVARWVMPYHCPLASIHKALLEAIDRREKHRTNLAALAAFTTMPEKRVKAKRRQPK